MVDWTPRGQRCRRCRRPLRAEEVAGWALRRLRLARKRGDTAKRQRIVLVSQHDVAELAKRYGLVGIPEDVVAPTPDSPEERPETSKRPERPAAETPLTGVCWYGHQAAEVDDGGVVRCADPDCPAAVDGLWQTDRSRSVGRG